MVLSKLEEKRGEFVKPRTTKKKKLQVPAGKSICLTDLQPSNDNLTDEQSINPQPSTSKKKQTKEVTSAKKRKRQTKKPTDSTSEDDDQYSLQSSGESDFSFYDSDEYVSEHIPVQHIQSLSKTPAYKKTPALVISKDEQEQDVTVECLEQPTKEEIKEGDFVLVLWKKKEFPGLVISKDEQGATVDCMEPTKKGWKWPDEKDCLFYKWKDIKLKISAPKLVKRGLFQIST